MSEWFNYTATFKILVFGLFIGAALPALFAIGVRLNSDGAGVDEHGDAVTDRNRVLIALSWGVFAFVLVAVLLGVLFIARDFIGHQTGLYLLGAKPK